MVGLAANRDAVAHLKAVMGFSECRACQIISADRTMIRYQSCRAPEDELRTSLRDLANERQRFGYRRLFILLRRDGEPSGVNRIGGQPGRPQPREHPYGRMEDIARADLARSGHELLRFNSCH